MLHAYYTIVLTCNSPATMPPVGLPEEGMAYSSELERDSYNECKNV